MWKLFHINFYLLQLHYSKESLLKCFIYMDLPWCMLLTVPYFFLLLLIFRNTVTKMEQWQTFNFCLFTLNTIHSFILISQNNEFKRNGDLIYANILTNESWGSSVLVRLNVWKFKTQITLGDRRKFFSFFNFKIEMEHLKRNALNQKVIEIYIQIHDMKK